MPRTAAPLSISRDTYLDSKDTPPGNVQLQQGPTGARAQSMLLHLCCVWTRWGGERPPATGVTFGRSSRMWVREGPGGLAVHARACATQGNLHPQPRELFATENDAPAHSLARRQLRSSVGRMAQQDVVQCVEV